jgi:hypothetical protein
MIPVSIYRLLTISSSGPVPIPTPFFILEWLFHGKFVDLIWDTRLKAPIGDFFVFYPGVYENLLGMVCLTTYDRLVLLEDLLKDNFAGSLQEKVGWEDIQHLYGWDKLGLTP